MTPPAPAALTMGASQVSQALQISALTAGHPNGPIQPLPSPATGAARPEPLAPAAARPSAPARSAAKTSTGKSRSLDVLSELEKLRREAMQPAASASGSQASTFAASATAARLHAAVSPGVPSPAATPAAPTAITKAAGNGRAELSRSIEMTLKRADFVRARRFLLSFQVEDDQHRIVDAVRDLQVEIKDTGDASIEKLLLRLNIALHAKE
jgi:hypothetical protein